MAGAGRVERGGAWCGGSDSVPGGAVSLASDRMGPRPGRGSTRRRDRCPTVETPETVHGSGRVGTASRPERETRVRVGPDADGVGHHGKAHALLEQLSESAEEKNPPRPSSR